MPLRGVAGPVGLVLSQAAATTRTAVLAVGTSQSDVQITESLLPPVVRFICPSPRAAGAAAGTAARTPQDERCGYRVAAASPVVSDSLSVSVVSAGTALRSSIP
jgi:hypothetical protein